MLPGWRLSPAHSRSPLSERIDSPPFNMGLTFVTLFFALLLLAGVVYRIIVKARGSKEVARLREQGLYPESGAATDADVIGLAKSGHRDVALIVYRALHRVSLRKIDRSRRRPHRQALSVVAMEVRQDFSMCSAKSRSRVDSTVRSCQDRPLSAGRARRDRNRRL